MVIYSTNINKMNIAELMYLSVIGYVII